MRSATPRRRRQLGRGEPHRGNSRGRSADAAIFEAPEVPGVSERDRVFRRGLVLADALAAALALVVGISIIGDDALLPAATLLVPLAVLVSKAVGLYDRDELRLHKTTLDDVPSLLQLSTAYSLLVWLLSPLMIDGQVSREQAVGLWGLLFAASLFGRSAARALGRRAAPVERCLVVGDAPTVDRLESQLAESRGLRAEVVDRIDLGPGCDLGQSLR